MTRKHPHLARFHKKGAINLATPIPARRNHRLLSQFRGLTPMERARLNKRLAAGVYANSNGRARPSVAKTHSAA